MKVSHEKSYISASVDRHGNLPREILRMEESQI